MSDLPELALEVHGGVRRWRGTPSLAWNSQTIEVHRGADSEKIVVQQQFCSGPRRCPDADRV